MLVTKRNVLMGLFAVLLVGAMPGMAVADATYSIELQPTEVEPDASGEVSWGYRTFIKPPYIYTYFGVAVRDVLSTDFVVVWYNRAPIAYFELVDGQGGVELRSDYGDEVLDPSSGDV